jgi:hypothetical protein
VSGCSVPIAVRFPHGDVGRNIGTMSVSPEGGTCTDPFGLSAADREKLQATGGLLSATFRIESYARGEFTVSAEIRWLMALAVLPSAPAS